ncbi:MAG: ABC transporter permease [Clostridioides sp.]|jgi:ABC-type nitrate/sulfonate/bicarbonate transport system permease component|nr:ABC transporter permease [Clostridioides sp.]
MTNLETIEKLKNSIYPIVTFLTVIVVWQVTVVQFNVPSYILPKPTDIVRVFFSDYNNLCIHSMVTIYESIIGFLMSISFAFVIGIAMDFIPILRKCFYPITLVTQMIPTIIIAPLFMIWFGFGILPKVLMVSLTCFFPILISFVDGMETIDIDYLNLFKTMKASRFKTFIHLKFPMSLDKLFSGLKISATYAVMAATVAEWLGGTKGLGVYMVRAKSAYALDKVFASTILVIIFSLISVEIIMLINKLVFKYRTKKM